MDKFIIFAVILCSFKICSGQVLQFGICAEVETMKFFNLDKFLGKWYEIERFPTWYEDYGKCAYKTIEACGRMIEIEHGFVKNDIQYILHINSTYIPGDEAVFEIKESNIDPIGIPFSVIATDYINYAIVYGCKNSRTLGIKYISAWILSRTTTLLPELLDRAHQELNSIPSASLAYLEPVIQSENNCYYHWTAHINADYIESNHDEIDKK